jgi:dTDP-4-amino-4,6-dideoxy-D-galactose acyltransferase
MSADSICEYLEWDSQFFGRRIARTLISRLTDKSVSQLESWCRFHRIDCVYFLADSSDKYTMMLAQKNMFNFVDARVTLDLHVLAGHADNSSVFTMRNAIEGDIPELRALAGSCHRDSRFYHDENFPDHLCDELYRTWIEKSCRGWAKKVLVAGAAGVIDGYLTCHLMNSGIGQIGLVGVADKAKGKGIGTSLVSHAVRWFAQEGAMNVSVVTQARNVSAQRLYQKCGFATRSVEFWFHRWFTRHETANDKDTDSI